MAIAVAGNFADTQFHLLSVTFEIINAQTDRVAVEKTLHFIEAASANYYRLDFPKIMETTNGSLFTHLNHEDWIFIDFDFLRNIKLSTDPTSKLFSFHANINNVQYFLDNMLPK